ncbi:MAG: transglycosylase domain-containing protein [Rhodothalassiaceae bacterium]
MARAARSPQGRRGRLRRILHGTAVAAIWTIIASVLALLWLAHDLPDPGSLPAPGGEPAVVVKAVTGKTLASYGPIYGDWLAYEEVPEPFILALLAIEDRRFFSHGAFDPRGVLRAIWINVRAGRLQEGGSTLTQQLAKNLFLTPRRSLRRKAQELMLALWLEREFTKQQILTLYLNRVYFGAGAYGLDAASRTFFGHSARTLTLAEAAMLAGIVKAPSRLAPTHDPGAARARAETVLAAMVDAGFLTSRAAARARAHPAQLAPDAAGPDIRYFTDWVRERAQKLVRDPGQAMVILTSLDPTIEAAAEAVLREHLAREGADRDVGQGALVALAPDGAVLAMLGGRRYGESQFNRATQARRQPGSAFKPFVYLAGFEAGLGPDSVLDDAPISIDGWSPTNFSGRYRGPVALHQAFAQSINTVAVRVAQHAGLDAVAGMARRFGIESPIPALPSIALGSAELSLLELTGAYAGIANGGYRVTPYAIIEIQSPDGEILYRYHPQPRTRAVAEAPLMALVSMMTEVMREGTGRAAAIDRPAAGKTGTSQDFRDAVFVGFTSDIVAGVWVGNDDNRPMRHVTGGGLPARIWADFMIDAHIGRPPRPLLQIDSSPPS